MELISRPCFACITLRRILTVKTCSIDIQMVSPNVYGFLYYAWHFTECVCDFVGGREGEAGPTGRISGSTRNVHSKYIYIYLLTTQQQQRLPITSTHDKECVLLVIVIITIAKPRFVRERCVNSWLHVAGDWAHALAPHSSGNQIIVCNVFNNKDHTLAGFTLRDEPCHLPTKNDTRWSCWIILNWFSFKCERSLKMRCRIVDEQINSILNQRKKPQYAVFRNCMMPPWTVVSRNFCLLCLFCGWQIFDANDVYIYVYIYKWMNECGVAVFVVSVSKLPSCNIASTRILCDEEGTRNTSVVIVSAHFCVCTNTNI